MYSHHMSTRMFPGKFRVETELKESLAAKRKASKGLAITKNYDEGGKERAVSHEEKQYFHRAPGR